MSKQEKATKIHASMEQNLVYLGLKNKIDREDLIIEGEYQEVVDETA